MRITKKVQAQLDLVKQWMDVPEGTPVIVTLDQFDKGGPGEKQTKTRSGPWMLGSDSRDESDPTHCVGHTAVIMLEGISGCYSLERVRKA